MNAPQDRNGLLGVIAAALPDNETPWLDADAVVNALTAAGLAIVPVQATAEMIEAGARVIGGWDRRYNREQTISDIAYDAALAASPFMPLPEPPR